MNPIFTRNGEPHDFGDGLRVRGILLDGGDGAKAIAFNRTPVDKTPTSLFDWIMETIQDISDIQSGALETVTAKDQAITDDSINIANTHHVRQSVASLLQYLQGNAPSGLNTIEKVATALGNDPNALQTLLTKINQKVSAADLQSASGSAAIATGTGNVFSAVFTPAITSVSDNVFYVKSVGSNTGAGVTFTPNAGVISPEPIIKGANIPLIDGDIPTAGYTMILKRDPVLRKWILLNPAAQNAPTFATDAVALAGTDRSLVLNAANLAAVLASLTTTAPATLKTISALAKAINNDPNFAVTLADAIALLAPKANPNFTGDVMVPTASQTDSSDRAVNTRLLHVLLEDLATKVKVQGSEVVAGQLMLANASETIAGLIGSKAIHPSGLAQWWAGLGAPSELVASKIRMATELEGLNGTARDLAISPYLATVMIQQALSSFSGAQTPPATPTIDGPTSVIAGQSVSVTLHSAPTNTQATLVSFSVSVNGGLAETIVASSNQAAYSWTPTGGVGTSSTISVTAKDSNGKVSNASIKTVTIGSVTINQPAITLPLANATKVSIRPSFAVNSMTTTGGADSHKDTTWTVVNSSGATVWSSINDTINKTSITVPSGILQNNQTYTLQVYFRGTTYGSSATTSVSFTTAVAPDVAVVTGNNSCFPGQAYVLSIVGNATSPATAISNFLLSIDGAADIVLIPSLVGGSYQYTYTWPATESAKKAGGSNAVFSVKILDNTTAVSAAAVKTISIGTISVNTPSFVDPTEGLFGASKTLTANIAAMVMVGATEAQKNADWWITKKGSTTPIWSSMADAVNKTSIAVPIGTLAGGIDYVFYAVQRSTSGVTSPTAMVNFKTKTEAAAVVTSDSAWYIGSGYPIVASATPEAPSTLISSFRYSLNGGAPVSVVASSNTATFSIPVSNISGLAAGTVINLSLDYITDTGAIGTPVTKTLTVSSPSVTAPMILSPVNGATAVSTTPMISISPFDTKGSTITYSSTDWVICPKGSTTPVWSSLLDTVNKTSISVPISLLAIGTEYVLKVSYNSVEYGASPVASISFTTITSSPPMIVSPGPSETNLDPAVLIYSSPFTMVGTTHSKSSWRVATDAAMTTIVAYSIDDLTNLLNWKPGTLLGGTQYWVQVKHTGANGNGTNWSDAVTFTTGSTAFSVASATIQNSIIAGVYYHTSVATDGDGTWVICGEGLTAADGGILVSHDNGATWTMRVPMEQSVTLDIGICHVVRYVNGKFLLGCFRKTTNTLYYRRILKSVTGDDWTVSYQDTLSMMVQDFASDGIVTLAMGMSTGPKYLTSSDGGQTFTLATLGVAAITAADSMAMYRCIYSEKLDLFIFSGIKGVYWSASGAASTWTACTGPATFTNVVPTATRSMAIAELNGVIYVAGPSVATSTFTNPSRLHKSIDGKVFTAAVAPPGGECNQLLAVGDYLYALTDDVSLSTKSNISRTKDGLTWETISLTTSYKFDMDCGPEAIIAVGYGLMAGASSGGIVKLPNFSDPKINAPTLTGASAIVAGTLYPLTMAAIAVVDDPVLSFDVALDGGTALNVLASNGQASYSVPTTATSAKIPGQMLGISVVTNYASGKTSSRGKKFVMMTGVKQPEFITPAYGTAAMALTATCTINAAVFFGITATHASTSWDIRTAANGGGLSKYALTDSTTAKTSMTIPTGKLANSVTYYLRVQQKSSTGELSPWSEIKFTTVAAASPPASASPRLDIITANTANSNVSAWTGTATFVNLSLPAGSIAGALEVTTPSGATLTISKTYSSTDGVNDYYTSVSAALSASHLAAGSTLIEFSTGYWVLRDPGGSNSPIFYARFNYTDTNGNAQYSSIAGGIA